MLNALTDFLKAKLEGIQEGAQVNVKSDWEATSGDAEILNKPNLQHFIAASLSTVTVGTSANSPSFLTGMNISDASAGFTGIDANGAIVNESGREIKSMTGSISFQPDKSGGGTTSLSLWSERSDDGVTWTQNSESLRTIEVANNGEAFKTSISAILNWEDGHYLRFRVYASGGGAVSFISPTDTVLGGEVIVGASVIWELSEH